MIDTHIHFWRYHTLDYAWISDEMPALKQDRLPEHIIPTAQQLGIHAAIAVQARCHEAENDFLLQLATQHDWLVGVVGWLDFQAADVQEKLAHYADHAMLKGFRHLVQDEPNPSAYWLDPNFQRGVLAAQQHHFVYDLLCHQSDLSAVTHFSHQCDDYFLVLDHLGKPDFRQPEAFEQWQLAINTLAQCDHVAVKISGLLTECGSNCQPSDLQKYLNHTADAFGVDRLMWGSDWSVLNLSGHDYATWHNIWSQWVSQFSANEQHQMNHENAVRIYGLPTSRLPEM